MSIYKKESIQTYKRILFSQQIEDDWLLLQTILTCLSRRRFAEGLPIPADQDIKAA